VARKGGRPISGWIAVDKPQGITAAAVVARVKRSLDAAKVGHGGTLDPLATGMLPIALGEATKTVAFIMDSRKTYEFEITWGSSTDTDDSEGDVTEIHPHRPDSGAVMAALGAFTGEITQVPPDYSAIKVAGKRAYDLARNDQPLELKARQVTVNTFEFISAPDPDHAQFRVDCGKGTYIRSLARDLGLALGTRGHISKLRRTRCGPFHENQAISLDKLEALGHKAADSEYLLPVGTVLDDIPALALTAEEATRIGRGQAIALWPVARRSPMPGLAPGTTVKTVCGDKLIAVAEVGDGMVRPVRVLNL